MTLVFNVDILQHDLYNKMKYIRGFISIFSIIYKASLVIVMKVDKNFILRQVADEYLLIPVGEMALRLNGIVGLSESGYLLYQNLQEGCTREGLIGALLQAYEVSAQEVEADVDQFLEQLRQLGILEEEK